MKKISVGISPCPNDTFVFGALVKGYIDTKDYELNFHLLDVEKLNELSQKEVFDVIKISVANYKLVKDRYFLLSSGAALGRGVGPIVVAKKKIDLKEIPYKKVGIPGRFTTAAFLFNYFFKPQKEIYEYPYNRIIDAILKEEIDVGILIHETRFVYQSYGLIKIADLGMMWEDLTSFPIPLGIIVSKKSLGKDFSFWMENKIRESLKFAYSNKEKIWDFIKKNAQEMDDKTINSHIETFVNSYTYDLKEEGKRSILRLIQEV